MRAPALLALLVACGPRADPSSSAPDDRGPPSPAAATAPAPPSLAPSEPLVDPAAIVGYVASHRADEGLIGRHPAVVASVVREAQGGAELVTWKFELRPKDGPLARLDVIAPAALPPPLRVGDPVTSRVQCGGGGPNRRCRLVIDAHDGTLLLAVDLEPEGWQVREGAPLGVTREGAYRTRRFGVTFERGAARIDAPGQWRRVEFDGAHYYLWGAGAERTPPPRAPLPPDYVGAWMDYAIVRAR